ncbi:GTP-binding protein [Candidatus Gracilibacteria bacterium]|nr:GTP-binding protein [Candidatus Gracilibacteria bacterium]
MGKQIPITILTGFLGSGKTTLLNHIIRSANGRKIAVVENEFGSTGIDAELIEKSTEEIVEISDGCICCTVRKDFMEAIERLLASGREIDNIIIECSGMSEPLPIAQSFLMNDMNGRVKLDSIICLVDAENITGNLTRNTQTALEQIEFADYIIITKGQNADKKILESIEDIIRKVNAYAPILNTKTENITLDHLLDTDRISLEDAQKLSETTDEHAHSESMGHYVHHSEYIFDHIKLSEFFRDLPYSIYRVKGFVRLDHDREKVFLIQKVGARFTVEEQLKPTKEYKNTLVFIGEGIEPFHINIDLAKCRAQTNS